MMTNKAINNEIELIEIHTSQFEQEDSIETEVDMILQVITTNNRCDRCCFQWTVKDLRYYGGFAPFKSYQSQQSKLCNSWLFVIVMCIYHLGNAGFVIIWLIFQLISQAKTTEIDNKWCPSLDINITLLQIESALLYGFGLYELRHHRIEEVFKDYYQPISHKLWMMIIIITLFPWIAGLMTIFDHENWQFGTSALPVSTEIMLRILALLRYWPPASIVIILLGHLSTFPQRMNQFVQKRTNGICTRNSVQDTEIPVFSHRGYKSEFKRMVIKYKDVLRRFSGFIVVFFICSFITMCIVFWTLVRNFFGKGCDLSFWYHFHVSTEIAYALILWAILIKALNKNYQLIVKHKYDIMYMDDEDDNNDQNKTLLYLKSITEKHCPFSINVCGKKIIPSTEMLALIIGSIVVPVLVQVVQFANSFY